MRAPRTGTYEVVRGEEDIEIWEAPAPASGTPEIGEEIVVEDITETASHQAA